MKITQRLALAPALAVAAAGLYAAPAHATPEPLSSDALNAGVVANCQASANVQLTLEQLAPTVVGQADVDVIPGELTAHIYSVLVDDGAGTTQHCTFGVLHRDVALQSVKYEGTVHVELADANDATAPFVADTDFEFGNLGHSGNSLDRTPSTDVDGFLVSLDSVASDPTFTVDVTRSHLEATAVGVPKATKDAAKKLLDRQTKAAAQLYKRQAQAAKKAAKDAARSHGKSHAKGHGTDKALAAAQKAYAKKVAAAQAAYQRATEGKKVYKPVSQTFHVTGTVTAAN